MGFRGGGSNWPPPAYPGFQAPQAGIGLKGTCAYLYFKKAIEELSEFNT